MKELFLLKQTEEEFHRDAKLKLQSYMEDLNHSVVQNSIFLDKQETEFESLFALKIKFAQYLKRKGNMLINLELDPSQARKILYWQKEDPFTKLVYKERKSEERMEEEEMCRLKRRHSSF